MMLPVIAFSFLFLLLAYLARCPVSGAPPLVTPRRRCHLVSPPVSPFGTWNSGEIVYCSHAAQASRIMAGHESMNARNKLCPQSQLRFVMVYSNM